MTTALYRRYRPETFEDVIGQEHVTGPLVAAIGGQRVSHAYLFSGPRGCGKTTSARILARCLNCERGPTPTPCGECASCQELARGGSGSLDVVEIDAASHNGVDDARELRERAAFAPARDRYKIFILDEAHMVTTQGFNALLKLVEEPPEHVKFVFATTEPDKVIGTIRSRTHHYPFRLVPPERLQAYLEEICRAEGVEVGSGVLPLVVRAGGGSVRDSLSVLDQLIAGSDGAIDYAQAVALLGYTPAALLDDVVDALAAADGASMFRVVDRVIESGHDPRRFVEDLLQRLRDLIVIVAVGERAGDVLRGVPEDQLQRMRTQAEHLGLAQLSRAGDLTNTALTEMTGATSPRLQLELLCARLLLPAADEPLRGFGARIERLERLVAPGGPPPTAAEDAPSAGAPSTAVGAPPRVATPRGTSRDPSPPLRGTPPEHERPTGASSDERLASPGPSGLDTETVRRRWPEVLETLSGIRRASWTIAYHNAQVVALDGGVLRLRFDTPGIASAFRTGQHAAAVERALRETLGIDVRIEASTDDGAPPGRVGAGPRAAASRRGPGSRAGADPAVQPADPGAAGRSPGGGDPVASASADWASAGPADDVGQAHEPPSNGPQSPPEPRADSERSSVHGQAAGRPRDVEAWEPPDDEYEPDPEDPDLEGSALVGAPLVERLLGGTVIDDIPVDRASSPSPGAP